MDHHGGGETERHVNTAVANYSLCADPALYSKLAFRTGTTTVCIYTPANTVERVLATAQYSLEVRGSYMHSKVTQGRESPWSLAARSLFLEVTFQVGSLRQSVRDSRA